MAVATPLLRRGGGKHAQSAPGWLNIHRIKCGFRIALRMDIGYFTHVGKGDGLQPTGGNKMSETTINPQWISWENVTRTYSGKTGCACGCGGTYTDKYEDTAKVTRRINFVNKNLLTAKIYDLGDEYCYEVENADGTRVTCVYVKAGVYNV